MNANTKTLDASKLYLGDNGRIFCGSLRCAGASAHFSGRGLSGFPVAEATMEDATAFSDAVGAPMSCECCGQTFSFEATR